MLLLVLFCEHKLVQVFVSLIGVFVTREVQLVQRIQFLFMKKSFKLDILRMAKMQLTSFCVVPSVAEWSKVLTFFNQLEPEPKTPIDVSSSPGKLVLQFFRSILPASHLEVKSVLVGPSGTIRQNSRLWFILGSLCRGSQPALGTPLPLCSQSLP